MISPKTNANSLRRLWLRLLLLLVIVLGIVVIYYSSSSSSQQRTTADNSKQNNSTTANEPKSDSGSNSDARHKQAVLVSVVKVAKRDLDKSVTSVGTITPSESVTIRSQVTGPITQVLFSEGQLVKQGDKLFVIDPRPFQAELDLALGQLAQNKSLLANAQQDLQRYQVLFKQDSIARQRLDTQASLVAQYKANQKSLQAQVEQARLNLSYSTIVAPIGGRIGLRTIDVGNLVVANGTEGLTTITQMQPADVVFSLPEIHVAEVAEKFYQNKVLPVDILGRSNQQVLAHGQLLSMDNAIDATTGTVKLKARFDNKNFQLFSNQFVNVRLQIEKLTQVVSVDTDAIQYGKQGAFVFLVQANKTVTMQHVVLGVTDTVYTQVIQGLAQGDQVVLEGVDSLSEGSKVEIKP